MINLNPYDEMVRIRMPSALVEAIDAEANAQFLTRSAYIRRVLAADVGLLPISLSDKREIGQEHIHDT